MDLETSVEKARIFLKELYATNREAYVIVRDHSESVYTMARGIAIRFPSIDHATLGAGALLHDCGIINTNTPKLHCHGELPYLAHGVAGEEILLKHNWSKKVARVCATHVGVGITKEQIEKESLPLPLRNFTPRSLEEEIIAYADCFFSKRPNMLTTPKSFEQTLSEVSRHGTAPRELFLRWHQKFSIV